MTLVVEARSFGYTRFDNGAASYGERSRFMPGEEKWMHTIYPALHATLLNDLEVDFGLRNLTDEKSVVPLREAIHYSGPVPPIHEPYKEFLKYCNGARLFGGHFVLYGVRTNELRSPIDSPEPIELLDANVFQRPSILDDDYLVIGGYRADGTIICMDSSGRCQRIGIVDRNDVLFLWESLADLIGSECSRLLPCFDSVGRVVTDDVFTLPGD